MTNLKKNNNSCLRDIMKNKHFTPEQAMKAQRGSRRIELLFI